MDTNEVYIAFLRSRISELLAQRGVSEVLAATVKDRFTQYVICLLYGF